MLRTGVRFDCPLAWPVVLPCSPLRRSNAYVASKRACALDGKKKVGEWVKHILFWIIIMLHALVADRDPTPNNDDMHKGCEVLEAVRAKGRKKVRPEIRPEGRVTLSW